MTDLFHPSTTLSFCFIGNNCVVVLRGVRLQLGRHGRDAGSPSASWDASGAPNEIVSSDRLQMCC